MDLSKLITENRDAETMGLDSFSSLQIVEQMNKEDAHIPIAISKKTKEISAIVDAVTTAFENGHRLIYMGAGTSGRLGVLDASECPPTFGVEPGMVIGLIAGGDTALRNAVENAEDSADFGKKDLEKINLEKGDVVVGLAASGRTPYVVGGLDYANSLGCVTGCVVCNIGSEIGKHCKLPVELFIGPEVLTGSTRLKSGTAQKMVCNMITTGAMIRIGKSYQNLMVDVVPTNAKLHVRAENIIMNATGVSREEAKEALIKTNDSVKVAIVMILAKCSADEAINKLKDAKGHVRIAINQ